MGIFKSILIALIVYFCAHLIQDSELLSGFLALIALVLVAYFIDKYDSKGKVENVSHSSLILKEIIGWIFTIIGMSILWFFVALPLFDPKPVGFQSGFLASEGFVIIGTPFGLFWLILGILAVRESRKQKKLEKPMN